MGLKLTIFKALGAATLAGVGAAVAQNGTPSKRKKGGCTPCAAAAALDKARTAARTGKF